jgi:hypothetical protein
MHNNDTGSHLSDDCAGGNSDRNDGGTESVSSYAPPKPALTE